MDIIHEARRVFEIEIDALQKMHDSLDYTFSQILELVTSCEGKVVITGIGKPGHIGTKIAATFASLGTPSFYLHPAEAMHGDLGMVTSKDVVIVLSYSGESKEIVTILPSLKMLGASLVGITGNPNSTLAKACDYVQILPRFEEACYMGLAPTSSTTVELVYGDALAVVASAIYGFKDSDFGKYHPAGSLGKKLILKVKDVMSSGEDNAVISEHDTLKDAIVELSKKGLGMVSIVDKDGFIKGIITDGDVRRQLEKNVNVYDLYVEDVMTKKPAIISKDRLAIEALQIMKKKNVSCIPVVEEGRAVGTIRLQDVIGIGIVG